MRNTKREIECLKRMQELHPVYEELFQFLLQEFLLSKEEFKAIKNSPSTESQLLYAKLVQLSDERKLQLLEFEWSILPTERIRINVVTDRGFREFIAEV